LIAIMIRFFAWLSLAILLAGPQGLAGWKHSSLHNSCRAADRDRSGTHCEGDGEFGAAGCWICTSTILGAAEHCDTTPEIGLAPPAHDDVLPSCTILHSCSSRPSSARAPPLS
jgi:hypothetical protein